MLKQSTARMLRELALGPFCGVERLQVLGELCQALASHQCVS